MVAEDRIRHWQTPDGERLAVEVLGRLAIGESLDDLRLAEHNGRVDLRGLLAPKPAEEKRQEIHGWSIAALAGLTRFEGARLEGLDLSGARLESLRFFNTTISGCCFDGATCRDWRLWAVDVNDTSFDGADLRKAVLGAWHEGRGDVFRRVTFLGANLRSIICPTATFIDCDFADAHLANVDFQSTSFIRCRFAGLLREVMFYDHGFKTGKPDPNPMEDVDFSEAELRMVEFRRLNLEGVKLPTSRDHWVVHNYRSVLERAVHNLGADTGHRGLRAILEHRLKWAGPHQEVGVFNRRDFVEMFDDKTADFAVDLFRRLEAGVRR